MTGTALNQNDRAVAPRATQTRTLLSCRGLTRVAGGQNILDIDHLELQRGRTYLLSGSNGAGKTTLLRVLAGLEGARCEQFLFDGISVELANYPRRMRSRLGFVHHHPVMFSTSVADNIAYGLRAAGVARPEVRRRTDEAIEWADIGMLATRPPQALSAGEKQRVALARAHALDPAVYLLDEPTANLDENGRVLVTGLIGTIAREGRTLLIACHDRELLALDGVVRLHMRAGRLE